VSAEIMAEVCGNKEVLLTLQFAGHLISIPVQHLHSFNVFMCAYALMILLLSFFVSPSFTNTGRDIKNHMKLLIH
jgi:hypothetical protein